MNKALALLLLVTLATVIKCEDEPLDGQKFHYDDNVMILTEEDAQSAVDDFHLIIIKFFAPWCGHCKSLAPVWKQVARTMSLAEEEVKVASIDCTVHAQFCQKHGIRGYPTLKYFIDGQAHQYSGKRGHDDLVEWLKTKPHEVWDQMEAEQM